MKIIWEGLCSKCTVAQCREWVNSAFVTWTWPKVCDIDTVLGPTVSLRLESVIWWYLLTFCCVHCLFCCEKVKWDVFVLQILVLKADSWLCCIRRLCKFETLEKPQKCTGKLLIIIPLHIVDLVCMQYFDLWGIVYVVLIFII